MHPHNILRIRHSLCRRQQANSGRSRPSCRDYSAVWCRWGRTVGGRSLARAEHLAQRLVAVAPVNAPVRLYNPLLIVPINLHSTPPPQNHRPCAHAWPRRTTARLRCCSTRTAPWRRCCVCWRAPATAAAMPAPPACTRRRCRWGGLAFGMFEACGGHLLLRTFLIEAGCQGTQWGPCRVCVPMRLRMQIMLPCPGRG